MKKTPLRRKRLTPNRRPAGKHWQLDRAWRELVAARDGHCCQVCGDTWMLECHHVWGRVGDLRRLPENGWTLCRKHHAMFHASLRFWRAKWRKLYPWRAIVVDALRKTRRDAA